MDIQVKGIENDKYKYRPDKEPLIGELAAREIVNGFTGHQQPQEDNIL
jgi:hypothetical protein